MTEKRGQLIGNREVRLSELAHESNSTMFLTPSGDVFWKPVGDMYCMRCLCVSMCMWILCVLGVCAGSKTRTYGLWTLYEDRARGGWGSVSADGEAVKLLSSLVKTSEWANEMDVSHGRTQRFSFTANKSDLHVNYGWFDFYKVKMEMYYTLRFSVKISKKEFDSHKW